MANGGLAGADSSTAFALNAASGRSGIPAAAVETSDLDPRVTGSDLVQRLAAVAAMPPQGPQAACFECFGGAVEASHGSGEKVAVFLRGREADAVWSRPSMITQHVRLEPVRSRT